MVGAVVGAEVGAKVLMQSYEKKLSSTGIVPKADPKKGDKE